MYKIRKIFKDLFDVVCIVLVVYFFVLGVLDFYNSKIHCDYVQTSYYDRIYIYNYTDRVDLVSLRAYVNTTGLFDNGYIFGRGQYLSNCSFNK